MTASNFYKLIFTLLICINGVFSVQSQETSIMIRVQAKDAKFIGTSIGGAKVIVKDQQTGKILAEGITTGSTGNTNLIMSEPQIRGKEITDEKTAGFLAHLDIQQPVFVTIEATAPINKKQAAVTSSTQLWIFPGKDIRGDGIVLEVPGFIVDIISPQTHERISTEREIEVRANIILMCGCPVTSNGIWNADGYEIKALVTKEGEETIELNLIPEEKPSTFSEKINLAPGYYEILVYAFDPQTGNSGLDKTNIIIN